MTGPTLSLQGFAGWTIREYHDAAGAPPTPGEVLFQQATFLELKGYDNVYIFDLCDPDGNCRLRLPFAAKDDELISLPGAPYGGPAWVRSLPGTEILAAFFKTCAGMSGRPADITINLMPAGYMPEATSIARALELAGYEQSGESINHHVDLREHSDEHLHSMQRRRLFRARQSGLLFEKKPPAYLEEAYGHIHDFRTRRDHGISMSLAALREAFGAFPDRYHLFTVSHDGRVLAVLIAVTVSPDVLYYFLPANDPEAGTLSPSVFLISELSLWAKQKGYAVLDLGTSMLPGNIKNESLAIFKKRMGGIPSVRQTFHT